MNTTDKLPETKSISSHQAYTEGFVQGVRFCEKYGIPANPTPLSNTKEQVPLFTTEQYKEISKMIFYGYKHPKWSI